MESNDWIRVQSRSTGAYYWSNVVTGQSAWELDSMKIEKVERDQFVQKIPSGGAYMVPQVKNMIVRNTPVPMKSIDTVDIDIGTNHPGDSSNMIEKARSDLIHYLETLTKVDGNLGEILSTMPANLKRNIESEQFRVRANARFKELLFLDSKNYLTVDEFAPQAADLVSDKDWAVYLEPAEISRGIFRIFGSQLPKLAFEKSNENKFVEETNDKNESVNNHELSDDLNPKSRRIQQDTMETINEGEGEIVKKIDETSEEIVLKKVAFQRILAACTIVTFLETHGGEGLSSNKKKLMASLSQYMKDVNLNQTATRLKAERVAADRTKQLTSTPRDGSINDETPSLFVGFVRDRDEVHIEAHNPSPASPISESSSGESNNNQRQRQPPSSPQSDSHSTSTSNSRRLSHIFALPNSRVRYEVFVRRSSSIGSVRLRYGMVPVTAKPYQDFLPSFGVLEFLNGVSELYITLDLIRPTYEQLIANSSQSPSSQALPVKIVKELEIQLRSPSFDGMVLGNTSHNHHGLSIGPLSESNQLGGGVEVVGNQVIGLRTASCKISLIYSMPDMLTLQSNVGSLLEKRMNGKGRPKTPNLAHTCHHLQQYQNSSLFSQVKNDSKLYSLQEQMSRLQNLLGKPIVHPTEGGGGDGGMILPPPSNASTSSDEVDSTTGTRLKKNSSNDKQTSRGRNRASLSKSRSLPVVVRDRSNSKTRSSQARRSLTEKSITPQHSYLKSKSRNSLIKPQPRRLTNSTGNASQKSSPNRKKKESSGQEIDAEEEEEGSLNREQDLNDNVNIRMNRSHSDDEYWEQRKESSSRPIKTTHQMSMDRPPSSPSTSSTLKSNKKTISGNISRLWSRVSSSPTQHVTSSESYGGGGNEELKEEVVSDVSSENEEEIQTLKEQAEKVNQRLSHIAKELANAGITVEEGVEIESYPRQDDGEEEVERDHNASFSSLRSSVELPSNSKKRVIIPDKLALLRMRSTSQDSRSSRPRVSQTTSLEDQYRIHSDDFVAHVSRDRISRREPSPMKTTNRDEKDDVNFKTVNDGDEGEGLRSKSSNQPSPLNKKTSLLARMFRDSRDRSVEEDVIERNQNIYVKNSVKKKQSLTSSLVKNKPTPFSQPLLPVEETEDYDYDKIDNQMEEFLTQVFQPIISCSNQLSTIKCTPHHFFKLCGRNASKQALAKGNYIAGLTIQDLKDLCKKLKVDYLSSSLAALRKAFKMVDQGVFKELSETIDLFASQSVELLKSSPSNIRGNPTLKTPLKTTKTTNQTRRQSVVSKGGGNVLNYSLWAAAWTAHYEQKKIRSPKFLKLQDSHRLVTGRLRARHNWLKVVRTVTTARYWSTLTNFSWQDNESTNEPSSSSYHDVSIPSRSLSPASSELRQSLQTNPQEGDDDDRLRKPRTRPPPSPEMIEARNDKHKLMKVVIKSSSPPPLPPTTTSKVSIPTITNKKGKPSKTVEKMKRSIGFEEDDKDDLTEVGESPSSSSSPTGQSLEATMREWRKGADHRVDLFSEANKLLGNDKPIGGKKSKQSSVVKKETNSNSLSSSDETNRSNSLRRTSSKKQKEIELRQTSQQFNKKQPQNSFDDGEEETY